MKKEVVITLLVAAVFTTGIFVAKQMAHKISDEPEMVAVQADERKTVADVAGVPLSGELTQTEGVSADVEEKMDQFFHTWLQRWSFDDGLFQSEEKEPDEVAAQCREFLADGTEVKETFAERIGLDGDLGIDAAAFVQDVKVSQGTAEGQYIVTVSAYMAQDDVDESMFKELEKAGAEEMTFLVTLDEQMLITGMEMIR